MCIIYSLLNIHSYTDPKASSHVSWNPCLTDMYSLNFLLRKVCTNTHAFTKISSTHSDNSIEIHIILLLLRGDWICFQHLLIRHGAQGDGRWDREAHATFHLAHWWWCCDTQARAAERSPRAQSLALFLCPLHQIQMHWLSFSPLEPLTLQKTLIVQPQSA